VTKPKSDSSDRSRKSNVSIRGQKHPRQETDGEVTDDESSLAKKQKLARGRSTGLKTVMPPDGANGSDLPTPEITGEEEMDDELLETNAEDEDDGDIDDDDLEARMRAEFEKGDWDTEFPQPQDDDEGGDDDDDGDGGG
jgi:RNA polymerase II subunit A-like phosphatase